MLYLKIVQLAQRPLKGMKGRGLGVCVDKGRGKRKEEAKDNNSFLPSIIINISHHQ